MIDGINNVIHAEKRPLDHDEALLIVSARSPFIQAAVCAACRTSFMVMDEQVRTSVFSSPVKSARHEAEGHCRSRTYPRVFRALWSVIFCHCRLLAHDPCASLQGFYFSWSDGVLSTIAADTFHERSMVNNVGAALSWLSKPFITFETITPTLHYSKPIPGALYMVFCKGLRAFSFALMIASVNVGTSKP